MSKSDVDDVVKLEALSYGEHHWSKESFYNELENNLAFYYCAVDENNRLIGYAGCWHIFEEAHITTLSVHPDFRKQGVAQKLIFAIVDDCYKAKIKYIPPPRANTGKKVSPSKIYIVTAVIPNLLPIKAAIKKITGICGI